MEKLKTRAQIERILDKMGFGYIDFEFDRETLLYPSRLTLYDNKSNPVIEIKQPTATKLKTTIETLVQEGKLNNEGK